MKVKGKNYKSIWLDKKSSQVLVIDQRELPHKFKVLRLNNIKQIKSAIKNMVVRGAPLIGVTAAYGIYLAMKKNSNNKSINSSVNFLKNARPTAVNLSWALEYMKNRLLKENQSNRENMPGSAREVYNAEEEGVEFIWLSNPKKFIGNEKISSVLVEKMKLTEPDSSGRNLPKSIPNSDFEIKTDMAIKALGFDPENLPKLFNYPNLQVSKWGTIKINLTTMETNETGIFAAGDIVRGASLVVWAIRDGREAALSIHKYLKKNQFKKIRAA